MLFKNIRWQSNINNNVKLIFIIINIQVTTTCNSNAINLVKALGPDNIIDYTDNDAQNQLEHYGKYVNIIVKI